MNDLGQAGDAKAEDNVFSAQVPKAIQQRHVIRYRVTVRTALGRSDHRALPRRSGAQLCPTFATTASPVGKGARVPAARSSNATRR